MTIDEAIAFLSTCTREELQDDAFGDAEVYWMKDGKEVASGYFGGKSDEIVIEGPAYPRAVFKGAEATRLRHCGGTGRVERNDSTGPDDYAEGVTMPGLTAEGVLRELTEDDT